MNNNNIEQLKIQFNSETFTKGTYNSLSIIIRDKDGFVNATYMCQQFNKRFRKIKENQSFRQYFDEFKRIYTTRPKKDRCSDEEFMYRLNAGIPDAQKDLRGMYVDKRLINYITIWASPTYAIRVSLIMDSIDAKVHDVLNEKQLDDTVENATPIIKNIVKSIAPSINTSFEVNFCYGVRDRVDRLDSYERDELNKVINEYQSIKERLNAVEKKVDEWGSFVKIYHPEFEK